MFLYSAVLIALLLVANVAATPLDDYIWKEDPNYKWEDLGVTIKGHNVGNTVSYTGYMLNVTSQQWLTPEDTTRSIWWHILCVIVPDNVKYTHNASLWVTGWSNGDTLPKNTDEDIVVSAALAMSTGTITGAFFQVPNEKMIFSGDPTGKNRGEDAIIAYTWDHFLLHPDQPEWLLRLPMVKSVLRAMDAMTDFVATKLPETGCQLDYYTVAGASKRGWTTWLMNAVDPKRVVAIVPMVLDAIRFVEVMHHQYKSYNGWSFALQDYYDMNLTARFDDPNMHLLSTIVDPYYYFDRMTCPKLVVDAVGDEFQQPDDTHYWWNDLPEPKHFLMIPNAEHSLATGILEAVPAISTWIRYQLDKTAVPQMSWEVDSDNGDITVTLARDASRQPLHVRKYFGFTCAKSPRRDFRVLNLDDPCVCGVAADGNCLNTEVFWKFEDLKPTRIGGRTYVAHMELPPEGQWAAFFIDVIYEEDEDDSKIDFNPDFHPGFFPKGKFGQLRFTTEVSVVPRVFPYDDCSGTGCAGVLL